MHDSALMELMQHVMEAHGHHCTRNAALEGRSGTVYTIPLLAEDGEHNIIMDAQLTDDPLPMAAIADMADVLHDVGADVAVLCHLGSVEPGTEQDDVVLWSRPEMLHVIGDALLAQATGTDPEPLMLRPAQMPEPPVLTESVTDLMPEAFGETPFDLAALEQLGDPEPVAEVETTFGAPEHPGDEAGAVPSDEPTETPAYEHPLLPVRMTADEARIQLKDRLGHVENIQMVLQPVHLFDYECDLLAEGSLRYDTVAGRVQVHGTDKTVTDVDPEAVDPQGFTRMGEAPPLPSHERTLRASPELAKERSTEFLMETHSRMVDVEVEDEDNGYSYTEKRPVAPRPDHVRMHHLGTFHRVVWRFIGTGGQVDVDALDGAVVEEVLHRPDPDAMIIE